MEAKLLPLLNVCNEVFFCAAHVIFMQHMLGTTRTQCSYRFLRRFKDYVQMLLRNMFRHLRSPYKSTTIQLCVGDWHIRGEFNCIARIPGRFNSADGLTRDLVPNPSHPLPTLVATDSLHVNATGWAGMQNIFKSEGLVRIQDLKKKMSACEDWKNNFTCIGKYLIGFPNGIK